MTTTIANAIEIRATEEDTYAPGALIGHTRRESPVTFRAWTRDFDDISTDDPAAIELGTFHTGGRAEDAVRQAYLDWSFEQ